MEYSEVKNRVIKPFKTLLKAIETEGSFTNEHRLNFNREHIPIIDAKTLLREYLKGLDQDIRADAVKDLKRHIRLINGRLLFAARNIENTEWFKIYYHTIDNYLYKLKAELQPDTIKGASDMVLDKNSVDKIYHAYCGKFGDPKDSYWLNRFANQDKKLPDLELPDKERKIFVCAILQVISIECKGKFNFDQYAKKRWGYNFSKQRNFYCNSDNETALNEYTDQITNLISES